MNSNDNIQADTAKDTKRLKKKGWGEAKIEKWLKDKEHKRESALLSRQPEAEEWIAFLRSAVGHPNIGEFGLLLHSYETGPELESFKFKRQQIVPISEVTPAFIMELEEDVLCIFGNLQRKAPERVRKSSR
jgi:hypothetical protein